MRMGVTFGALRLLGRRGFTRASAAASGSPAATVQPLHYFRYDVGNKCCIHGWLKQKVIFENDN